MSRPTAISADSFKVCATPEGIDPLRMPHHVAVIMDGNGRWAKARGLPRIMGHRAGVEALKNVLRNCNDWGISALTVYAFSTENWSRPEDEVNFLMDLFGTVLQRELDSLKNEQVKISFLGDLKALPESLQKLIENASSLTKNNTGIHFNVCTNYGGRRELVQAAQKLARRSMLGDLDPSDIDENIFASELFTAGEQDPDLLIRTSGECRISNFLLWQLAYAEIHITNVLWPDFNAVDLTKAILDFQSRSRRFGGLEPPSSDHLVP